MKDPKKEQTQKKRTIANDDPKDRGEHERRPNTKVETDTGKRPEKDTNPLPPNPNKVDNHWVLGQFIGIKPLQFYRGRRIQQSAIDIEAGAVTRAIPRQFGFVPAHFAFGMRTGALQ